MPSGRALVSSFALVVMVCGCYRREPNPVLSVSPSIAAPVASPATAIAGAPAVATAPPAAAPSAVAGASGGGQVPIAPQAMQPAAMPVAGSAGTAGGPAPAPTTAGSAAPAPAAPSACMIPTCLTDVLSRCVPMGECVMAGSSFADSTTCFANGVKVKVMVSVAAELSIKGQTFNPDGTVCYAIDGMSAAEGITINYRDAAGAPFASSTLNPSTMMGSVTCPGQAPVMLDSMACGPPGGMMMMMGGMMMGPPMCMGTGTCM